VTDSKLFQKRPSRKGQLLTPKSTQARVVAASLAGKNQSEIHRQLGISRPAIRRILSQAEVKALLAGYQDEMRMLIPDAIKVCAKNLRGRRASWQLAIEILKGLQVLIARTHNDVAHSVVDEIHSWSDDELKEYIRTGKPPAGPAGYA